MTTKIATILALETSCDETAAAVVRDDGVTLHVCSSVVASQVALHAPYGGVVPNVAAREHERAIVPIIAEALRAARTAMREVDLIAVTHGPGLIPALIVGVSAAKALAWRYAVPLMGVHHIAGHIYAALLEEGRTSLPFPLLALVVSGGHTQLVLMRRDCGYTIIGETQDDAVGEAFDKAARLLGLPYPGGPAIAEAAARFDAARHPTYDLPRPMLHSKNFHFSFSGLKTALLYAVRDVRARHGLRDDASLPNDDVIAFAHAFQMAAVDVLIAKTRRAARAHTVRGILLAGGVSANKLLRARLRDLCARDGYDCMVPAMAYCMDNAAMIAAAAAVQYRQMAEDERRILKQTYRTMDAAAMRDLAEYVV